MRSPRDRGAIPEEEANMKRIRQSPSPAMVVAFIALFAALSGGAYAAKKIGSKNLRSNAVTTKKIKNGAVTGKKIKSRAVTNSRLGDGAVTAAKIRDGAVGTTKIGDGGVTAAKLTPSERGEGFVANRPDPISLPAGTVTTVATLNLPPGSFIVTAGTALGGAVVMANNYILCDLRDDGTILTTGSGVVDALVYRDTVTLTGASDGGVVTMTCNPDAAALARSRTITATRVASVQAQ
jgi:hypothetical protein